MGRKDGDGERSGDDFAHDDPVVDEALAWFSRLRNVTPDPRTRAEFEAWLAQDPRHEAEFRGLEAIWGSPAFGKAAEALRSGPGADPRPRQRSSWSAPATRSLAAAAAVLLMIGVWQWPAILLHWQADYMTATGERTTISLPDASSMTLNTASAVAVDFTEGRRDVRLLAGEAFFDVRPDPAHPFRVMGQFGDVVVKGTAFSVRRDADEDVVVLERGIVSVNRKADHTELHPGQMVKATNTALSPVAPVDAESALAWRDGRVVFSDQPFERVIAQLSRYYTGTVILANASVGNEKVTGNYRLDDIEAAFRTLADAVGVSMYQLPGGLIIFR